MYEQNIELNKGNQYILSFVYKGDMPPIDFKHNYVTDPLNDDWSRFMSNFTADSDSVSLYSESPWDLHQLQLEEVA